MCVCLYQHVRALTHAAAGHAASEATLQAEVAAREAAEADARQRACAVEEARAE